MDNKLLFAVVMLENIIKNIHIKLIWSYFGLKVISQSNKDLCLLKCEKCEAFLIKYSFIKYKQETLDLRF